MEYFQNMNNFGKKVDATPGGTNDNMVHLSKDNIKNNAETSGMFAGLNDVFDDTGHLDQITGINQDTTHYKTSDGYPANTNDYEYHKPRIDYENNSAHTDIVGINLHSKPYTPPKYKGIGCVELDWLENKTIRPPDDLKYVNNKQLYKPFQPMKKNPNDPVKGYAF